MSQLINLTVFKNFFKSSNAGGILLFICVILSLIVANTAAGPGLQSFLDTPVGFDSNTVHLKYTTLLWINDGLMEMLTGLVAPMGLGISLGLLLGKPLGILIMTFVCSKLGISSLPEGSSFKHILGVGLLAGIGFTMSIFISILSFSDALHIKEAKLSILLTSLLAGILGYLVLSVFGKKSRV